MSLWEDTNDLTTLIYPFSPMPTSGYIKNNNNFIISNTTSQPYIASIGGNNNITKFNFQ